LKVGETDRTESIIEKWNPGNCCVHEDKHERNDEKRRGRTFSDAILGHYFVVLFRFFSRFLFSHFSPLQTKFN
jgi:hypothetical protein